MEQDTKRKGGRIPSKNFKFYGQDAVRSSNTRLAKAKFGSLAVDCLQAAHERMAQSDFALFVLDKTNLKRLELEDAITEKEFIEVMDYCTNELGMFDEVLFANGFLFSIDFVRTFDAAGLFRHRTYVLEDIIRVANHYRPGYPPLTAEDKMEIIAKGGVVPIPAQYSGNWTISNEIDSKEINSNVGLSTPRDLDPNIDELPF
jgi:hypothetical protein